MFTVRGTNTLSATDGLQGLVSQGDINLPPAQSKLAQDWRFNKVLEDQLPHHEVLSYNVLVYHIYQEPLQYILAP